MSDAYKRSASSLPPAQQARQDNPPSFGKATSRLAGLIDRPVQAVTQTPSTTQPPLSPTERIVLRLLMQGMTERQAGQAMQRSHNTVHVHIRNIYRKLGVSSRKMLIELVSANPELTAEDGPSRQAA